MDNNVKDLSATKQGEYKTYILDEIQLQRQIEIERMALVKTEEAIQPEIWASLSRDEKEQVMSSIRQTIRELFELEKNFKLYPSFTVEHAFSHLTPERINLITTSFEIQTFETLIDIVNRKVYFFKDGEAVLPEIPLDTVVNYERAISCIGASIVIESIILLLNIAGIRVLPGNAQKAAEKISVWLSRSEIFRDLLTKMANAAQSNDMSALARHMAALYVELFRQGKIMDIVRDLLSSMSYFDVALSLASFVTFFTGTFLTGGAAAIAALIPTLLTASAFLAKFASFSALTNQFKSHL